MTTFKDLNLASAIQRALDELGFEHPTEIQAVAIPLLLAEKSIDFHGQAQTGTGKTLAFGIPLVQRIDPDQKAPQALVVAPTRELAVQINESIEKIARGMNIKSAVVYGGVSLEEQQRTLRRGVHIVIGTPGRLIDHLKRRSLSLDEVKTLVLDEADEMLEMGFKEDIDAILGRLPKKRNIWLFSATVKPGIRAIIKNHMHDTVSVRITPREAKEHKTKQYFCIVPARYRTRALMRFIQAAPQFYGIVFVRTKKLAGELAEQLIKDGYNAAALHGDLSQAQRNRIIKKFKAKEMPILVATDVAARGIDVANLSHVINFSIPEDLESYVHRIGRTGRAGKEGIAITFISNNEQRTLQRIEREFKLSIAPIELPSVKDLLGQRIVEAQEYLDKLPKELSAKAQELMPLVAALTDDRLKKTLVQLLYEKFLATVDVEELEVAHHIEAPQDQLQEIVISAGELNGVTKSMVLAYLKRAGARPEQIKSIRIIKQRTFVKLAAECSPALLKALRGKPLDGRKVHVNLTCVVPGGGRRGRGGPPHRQRRRR